MFLRRLLFNKALNNRRSFTVMELVIVMAIFSIVLGVIIQIFIFTTAQQRRSRAIQQAQNEARTVLETVAREVQNGQIDYVYYEESEDLTSQPVNNLALLDSQGQIVRFRCVDDNNEPCGPQGQGVLQMCRADGCSNNEWAALVNEELDVTSWQAWVGPSQNPFKRNQDQVTYQSNEQPWVTMSITIKPRQVDRTLIPDVKLQTTVATRTYLR